MGKVVTGTYRRISVSKLIYITKEISIIIRLSGK